MPERMRHRRALAHRQPGGRSAGAVRHPVGVSARFVGSAPVNDNLATRTFDHYYEQLVAGERGLLPESSIEPVTGVPDFEDLPPGGAAARTALDHTVVLKLNGGLGTSMGMTRAKSLLEAKEGLT